MEALCSACQAGRSGSSPSALTISRTIHMKTIDTWPSAIIVLAPFVLDAAQARTTSGRKTASNCGFRVRNRGHSPCGAPERSALGEMGCPR